MSDSADRAVSRYIENYSKCRKLEAEIYGFSNPRRLNRAAIRNGRRFVLSELYELNLDTTEIRTCFRACRANEPDAPEFRRFNGVFAFTQSLLALVSDCVNNRSAALLSYSKSLAVALLRYSRATELKLATLTLNSVAAEVNLKRVELPLRELTSRVKLSAYELETFAVRSAAIAICECGRRELSRCFSDWNIAQLRTNVSYRKDQEVLTNSSCESRIRITAELRERFAAALNGSKHSLGVAELDAYLAVPSNLEFERRCRSSL
ncbi:MAG: hypothetical protein LBC65_01510 [Oscillospiraceae bacterium]|jgi:hypothetical protein|nr:hypothetical protein [Oscillospiraceae bacterium]